MPGAAPESATPEPRPTCARCRRPESVCVCATITPIPSRTAVVFVQHPREARVPVTTCRLAHLSLPNSKLFVGLGPERDPRLAALTAGASLLFPGPGATDVRDLATPPETLIVVDGTWINARKLIERSPMLSALPRVAFTPDRPSNYRIRKEPSATCVSTIEAVAHILDVLEDAPGRFTPILGAFDAMVDRQLEYVAARTAATRRTVAKKPPGGPLARLRALAPRAVLLFAEGDPWAEKGDLPVLHRWMAQRWSTGATFSARVRLSSGPIRDASGPPPEELGSARQRWEAWSQPGDVLLSWGDFAPLLLGPAKLQRGQHIDMRAVATNVLHRRLGGVERFAEANGVDLGGGHGTAERRMRALVAVFGVLTTEG